MEKFRPQPPKPSIDTGATEAESTELQALSYTRIDPQAEPMQIATAMFTNLFVRLYNDSIGSQHQPESDNFLTWLAAEDESTQVQTYKSGAWDALLHGAISDGGSSHLNGKIFWVKQAIGRTIGSSVYENPDMIESYKEEGEFVPDEPLLSDAEVIQARQRAAEAIMSQM